MAPRCRLSIVHGTACAVVLAFSAAAVAGADPTPTTGVTDLEAELFGETPSPGDADKEQDPKPAATPQHTTITSLMQGTTTVGGRADLAVSGSRSTEEPPASMVWRTRPAAYLFLDSRPRSDSRGYLRVSLTPRSAPGARVTGSGRTAAGTDSPSNLQLLELWGKWQAPESGTFWTVGRQPLRWGAAQFWNPTDFMSPEVRDPLALFDDRSGVDAARVNIPFESENASLIFVASLMPPSPPQTADLVGSMSQTRDVQLAARGEWSAGSAETAVSLAWSERGPTRTGLSLSVGAGPLDFVLEGACIARTNRTFFRRARSEEDPSTGTEGAGSPSNPIVTTSRSQLCLPQAVAGLSWQYAYGNSDAVTLGGEYFWNGLGHDQPDLELAAAVTGNAGPLYIGQQYAAAYGLLPGPGDWDDTSFQAQAIMNLTDASSLYRAAVVQTFLKSSQLALAATWRDGRGEFRLDEATVARALQNVRLPGSSSPPAAPAAPAAPTSSTAADAARDYARQTPRLLIDATVSLSL